MTEDQQKDVVILGQLKALHFAFNMELPKDPKLRQKFFKAKRLLFEVIEDHWDKCNEYLADTDTDRSEAKV
ncbi:hypothetical protein [Salinisphaera sp. G21_0]|uniref:hypothetical protein n=1 Tax=Salinisphaera sp. G21_0 TaxID=2821094 RepID=UPI001ADA969A|nr:hypothetical protein [Salinisphaera sp. G21_0]MBO9484324.1 hypothetical protein [Salinisphaera sp. G21_0]